MNKKIHLEYCFIDKYYLKRVFDSKTLKERKYETRPFLYFKELKIAIAFPQVTNHKNKLFWDNFYFDFNSETNKFNHYLNIGSFIYVPLCNISIDSKWDKNKTNIEKLNEINKRVDEILSKFKKVLFAFKYNQKFKDTHKFIGISKQLTFCKEKTKDKEKSKSLELER